MQEEFLKSLNFFISFTSFLKERFFQSFLIELKNSRGSLSVVKLLNPLLSLSQSTFWCSKLLEFCRISFTFIFGECVKREIQMAYLKSMKSSFRSSLVLHIFRVLNFSRKIAKKGCYTIYSN